MPNKKEQSNHVKSKMLANGFWYCSWWIVDDDFFDIFFWRVAGPRMMPATPLGWPSMTPRVNAFVMGPRGNEPHRRRRIGGSKFHCRAVRCCRWDEGSLRIITGGFNMFQWCFVALIRRGSNV